MDGFITVKRQPNIIWIYDRIINDRIDCNYYKVKYIEDDKLIQRGPYRTIGELLRNKKDLTGGATPLGANYLNDGVKFIRTQNVECNWINLDDVVYISDKVHNTLLKRSILEENDVLLTITGANFGKSAPVRKQCLPANISQHSVRIHLKDKIDPYFLSSYLNCSYGQSQIYKHSVGFTRPAIDYIGIKQIKIPTPPPKVQKYIGDKVRQAERLREESKRLKQEAQKIIDLQLNLNELNEILENAKYIKFNWINYNDILDRIDPHYYKLKYKYVFESICKHKHKLLREIASVNYGYMPTEDYAEVHNGQPLIRVTNVKEDLRIDLSDLKYIKDNILVGPGKRVYKGDILLVQCGNTTGKIAIVDERTDGYIFPSFCLKISLKQNILNPYYLAILFESPIIQEQIWQSASYSSVRPNTTKPAIEGLLIPIIDIDKQNEVGKLIENFLNNLTLAENLMQEAKKDVEDLIEGKFDYSKVQATVPESR